MAAGDQAPAGATAADPIEATVGQALRVPFACVDDAGQPIDLTGGRVEARIFRTGLRAFELLASTDDPTAAVAWTDRTKGTGTMALPLQQLVDPPRGLCRYRLRSTTAAGARRVQGTIWLRLVDGF